MKFVTASIMAVSYRFQPMLYSYAPR